MPQIPMDQLHGPQYFSILLVGPSKTGKTESIASLHYVLRMIKKVKPSQSTKMMIFDFDGDGFLPIWRLAKEGRERHTDKINATEPWIDDLMVFTYTNTEGKLRERDAAPHRPKKPIDDFHDDFNQIDNWVDHKTGLWKDGMGVGAIIFDSLTSLMHMYESYIWATRQKEIGLSGPGAITWQDWALVGERVRAAYQAAKYFPCFFVATAHEDTRQELIHGSAKAPGPGQPAQPPAPIPGAVWAVPMLTYSLSLSAAGDYGCVVHSTVDRKWVGRPGGRIRSAGSRLKDLPDGEFEANFENVISIS
jgi:hypothetical protein